MGAWGTGPFDNDDGLDALNDVIDAGTPEEALWQLDSMLGRVLGDPGYIEAPDMSGALAAACLIAVCAGAPGTDAVVNDWDRDSRPTPDARLLASAARIMDRAADANDNEWYEIWTDAGRVGEALAALQPYRQVLIDHSHDGRVS